MSEMPELGLCPYCGTVPNMRGIPCCESRQAECPFCGMRGPSALTESVAAALWNDLPRKEPTEPKP